MATVRRFYLYLVALISLMALMAGLIDLSVGLVRLALNAPPLAIDGVTVAGGDLGLTALVVLISAPIWGLHWWLANRRARALTMAGAPAASLRGRSAERSAATRKAYFYAGRFGALAASAGLAGLLIYELLAPRLHAPAVAGGWPAGPLSLAAGLLVAFLFWLYLYRASRADGDAGHERDAGAGWRRAYDYLGLWLATVAAAAGAVGILQAGLLLAGRILIGGSAGLTAAGDWRIELAAGLAALIVGLPIAVWHWRLADWVVADDPTGSEINSLGRKFALYTLLLGGVAVSVLSIAYLVMVSTLLLLGQPVDDLAAVWERTVAPLLG
ncbi:MAG TPA: DUF5671 domain-containing protein, partial [Anaerolineae bacterium]